MIAKRFTYDSKTVSIFKDGEFWLDGQIDTACNHKEICGLLNELHEENEQLRHDATILIQSNQDYRKENEQLKKQLMDCEKFRHTVYQEISKEMSKHD